MQKITTIDTINTFWYGKPKFHYVVKKNSRLLYSCTSVMKDQDEVLNTLIERYKNDYEIIHIYCNGQKLKLK